MRGENAKMEVTKLSRWPYQGAIPEQGLRRRLLDIILERKKGVEPTRNPSSAQGEGGTPGIALDSTDCSYAPGVNGAPVYKRTI